MTYIEYAEKLGINLTSAQIEILNLLEEHKDERVIITFPRMMGRQMLYNLIERKKGYEQGGADAIDEFKNFIRSNKHYFVGDMAEMLIYEFEQMQLKEQNNE